MFGLGPTEIAAILVLLVILVLAPKKLPELGSGIGKAITNFKKSYREGSAIDVTPEKNESGEQSERKKQDQN